MKWIAIIGLVGLAACHQAPTSIPLEEPKKGDPQTEWLADRIMQSGVLSDTRSICINGVVYYATKQSYNATTLTPAFLHGSKGTQDCTGGITIPTFQHYQAIK